MKKLFKLVPVALLGFCLVLNSCSEEDNSFLMIENVTSKSHNNVYFNLGYAQAEFFSYVFDRDEVELNDKLNQIQIALQDEENETLEAQATLYQEYFDVPISVSINYFTLVETYGSNLQNQENEDYFNQGFKEFSNEWLSNNAGIEKKWRFTGVFSLVAQATGAGCSGRVLAGFLDVAVSGAVAVSSGGTLGWGTAIAAAGLYVTIVQCTAK